MRTKEEILKEADLAVTDIRKRSMLECFYMKLGLEVLIDIRDILNSQANDRGKLLPDIFESI